MLTVLGGMVKKLLNQALSISASLQLQLIYHSCVLLYVILVETLSWEQQKHIVQKYGMSFCPPLAFQSLHTAEPFELLSSFSQQRGSFHSAVLDFRMMAIHISQHWGLYISNQFLHQSLSVLQVLQWFHCPFCWKLQITKLFTMTTCSNQKTFFHHLQTLFLKSQLALS